MRLYRSAVCNTSYAFIDKRKIHARGVNAIGSVIDSEQTPIYLRSFQIAILQTWAYQKVLLSFSFSLYDFFAVTIRNMHSRRARMHARHASFVHVHRDNYLRDHDAIIYLSVQKSH